MRADFYTLGQDCDQIRVDGEHVGYVARSWLAMGRNGKPLKVGGQYVKAFDAVQLLALKSKGYHMAPPHIKVGDIPEAMERFVTEAVADRDKNLLFGVAGESYTIVRPMEMDPKVAAFLESQNETPQRAASRGRNGSRATSRGTRPSGNGARIKSRAL